MYPLLDTIMPEPRPSSLILLFEENIELDLVLILEIPTTLSETFSKKAEEVVKTFLKLYDSFKKELKISKELKTFFDEESLENQGIENTEDFEKPLSHLILKIANDSGLLEYYTEKDALNSSGKASMYFLLANCI